MEVLFPIAATAGIFALVFIVSRAQHRRAETAWSQAAADLGLQYTPSGFGTRRQMDGVIDGHVVVVDVVVRGSGKNQSRYTRFRVRYSNKLPLRMRLSRQGFFSGVVKLFGAQDLEVGEAAFDDQVVIKGDDPHRIAAYLTPARRSLILRALESYRGIVIDDSRITWERHGVVTEPHTLRSVTNRMLHLAKNLTSDQDTPYQRAVAAREDGHLDDALALTREAAADPVSRTDARHMEAQLLLTAGDIETLKPLALELSEEAPDDDELTDIKELAASLDHTRPLEIGGGEPLALDETQACEALFSPDLATTEVSRLFEREYHGKQVWWTGQARRLDEHSFDVVFGKEGPVMVIDVYEIPDGFHRGQMVTALVYLQDSQGARSLVGEQVSFSGTLLRCDAFMRNIYVADGAVQRSGQG